MSTYFDNLVCLCKNAFSNKKYLVLPKALRVLTRIFMLPAYVLFLIYIAFGFLIVVIYNIIISPNQFLHKILHDEAVTLNGAAQFILYFISWPLIFFYYVLVASLTTVLLIMYLFAMITAYIASLGAFKINIELSKQVVEKDEVYDVKKLKILSILFVIANILIITYVVFDGITLFNDLYHYYREREFINTFIETTLRFAFFVNLTVSLLFTTLGFNRAIEKKQ